MKVTDLNFYLDDGLRKKLDLIINRVTTDKPKKDAVIVIEGDEGEGKSNLSCQLAYYIRYETKRIKGQDRPVTIFFRLTPLIEFAKSTEKQIIIWDEPSLDSLSTDSLNKLNKDLIRLLMTIRKKQHILFINMTKFYKFQEYIVVDRPIALIHVYSRRQIIPGRFLYIRKAKLEALYNIYRSSKRRAYMKVCSLTGSFVEVMEKHYNHFDFNISDTWGRIKEHSTLEDYENEKDNAIMGIGEEEVSLDKQSLYDLRGRIACIKKFPINNTSELCAITGIDSKDLQSWYKRYVIKEKIVLLDENGFAIKKRKIAEIKSRAVLDKCNKKNSEEENNDNDDKIEDNNSIE